jgi:hypothetical protein
MHIGGDQEYTSGVASLGRPLGQPIPMITHRLRSKQLTSIQIKPLQFPIGIKNAGRRSTYRSFCTR